MVDLRAAFCAALFLVVAPFASHAQDVTLSSPDGQVEITGTLLGFDGEFYRVDTRFGELTVDGSGVTCDGPGCPNLTAYVAEVAFSGSAGMAELMLPALIESFARLNSLTADRIEEDAQHFYYELRRMEDGVTVGRFDFRASNTDEGFADLLANETDIVLALREIRPEERRRIREAGMGDLTDPRRSRVLALDAMVPIVSPENPVQRISTAELARVFAGQIGNWQDLGGPDAPIDLHLPAEGSGLAQAVEDRLLRPADLAPARAITRHARSTELAGAVTRNPFAIGLASFAEIGEARVLTLAGECGFSLRPSRLTIKTEDYPLSSPMFLYLPARRLPKLARDFLGYLRGPAAQLVVRRAGFVDQTPEQIGIGQQGDRLGNAIRAGGEDTPLAELQRMVERLVPLARLTTTFRFEAGSARLDAQSRDNVQQLAHALEAGEYDSRELVFVGFSDGQGAAGPNLAIARKRAQAVHDAVLAAAKTAELDRIDISVDAFGEALPMACDDSAWGRQVNRRVEVWLR